MSEPSSTQLGLDAWFRNWLAVRDSSYKLPPSRNRNHRPYYMSPAKTCVACGRRLIAQGKSVKARYAKKARMCFKCYQNGG